MRPGCLALTGALLVLVTVAFGTAALYLELHDPRGHLRAVRPGKLLLLAVVLLVPLAGAGYLMYLEWRPHDPETPLSEDEDRPPEA
ncbi:MAG TPA: hypothetical protein VNH18_04600 [Bryobacteraceae bacterium]|nr:hypothetical protein [Bryobacteraceae bacterium]